jgi:hypothetical protein
MISLEQIIMQVLEEDNVAGGTNSAFGPGVTLTSTPFSGDNYAKGDARMPKILGTGKVIKRNGVPNIVLRKKKKVNKKHRRKRK